MHRILFTLALVGCGSEIATKFDPISAPRMPRAPETVDVFLSGRPPRALVDLGLITIYETDVQLVGERHMPQMLARLRTEGAAHGCDVVIGNPPQLHSSRWLITATCSAYADTGTASR